MARFERQVRIWGDPFVGDLAADRSVAFLEAAVEYRYGVSLCMSAARGLPAASPEGGIVALSDGAHGFTIHSAVGGATLERLEAAIRCQVPVTAPVVVFGTGAGDLLDAALEFPDSVRVVDGHAFDSPAALLAVVERELDSSAVDGRSGQLLNHEEFVSLAEKPSAVASRDRVVLHFASVDSGLELLLEALRDRSLGASGVGASSNLILRVVDAGERHRQLLAGSSVLSECCDSTRSGAEFDSVFAVVQPFVRCPPARTLLRAMAAGRVLIASRFGASAALFGDPCTVVPIGGQVVEPGEVGEHHELDTTFYPDSRSLGHALDRVLSFEVDVQALPPQARRTVAEHHVAPRLATPPAELRFEQARSVVVLEAPIFDVPSSTAHLTIETARALVARDRVEVLLRPTGGTGRDRTAALAARAPELVRCLTRRPPADADLWLSSGWPPRFVRPEAGRFAVRIDQEYGALPSELTPLVTSEADYVVVHSRTVEELVIAAGAPPDRVVLVPHGVDTRVFYPGAPPDRRVLDFKRERRAVLFVGGLIWRKGFDLVVGAMLSRFTKSDSVCLVVKPVGGRTSYSGYHLHELLDRLRAVAGAVDVLVLDEALTDRQMAGLFCASDLLLHPYRGEGFGLPVLEARACGLPVVVTEGGSTDDFCRHGVDPQGVVSIPSTRRAVELGTPHTGRAPFVLEPDAGSLGTALDRALDPTMRQSAIQAATSVGQSSTWDRAAAAIEGLALASGGPEIDPRSRREPTSWPVLAGS